MSHADEGTLHAYLDGALPAAERDRLEAHVSECAVCRDRLAEERGLIERADRLLALAELPASHIHRPAPVPARRARARLVVPGAWAASIALAFLAGWLLRPTPQSPASLKAGDENLASVTERDSVRPQVRNAPAELRRDTPTSTPASASSDSQVATLASPVDARVDNAAPARPRQAVAPEVTGQVAGPALRGAAPAPLPPTTVAVTPASPAFARMEAASRAASGPIGTTWTVIAPEPARKVLGTDVARIPGLPVRDIRQNPTTPGEVMVEQEIADGTVIQLIQSRLDSAAMSLAYGHLQAKTAEAVDQLKKQIGPLQVRISGPLAADSLLKLLELVR